ncbi:MAG: tetratricopeptide repeat protein [Eudoraea sp.]|nr:tetratricopeptide repeat protein [Eudoraea sp.]NNK29646.1 tetratricopeptide repeat protein [Flavobacteriaceae bacterium]
MQEHRLAAIMFTDIAGYTALMGSDEKRAFEMLNTNRDIHTHYLKKYNGDLVKEMGDGMLISFDLATNAVRCAIEIQIACLKKNIPLTIGIHEGEVIFEASDVFGDGVNIASRLQAATEKGGITISESVYRDVKNKADIKTQFIEERLFKNIDEPIKIYNVSCEEPPVPEGPLGRLRRQHRKPLIRGINRIITPVIAVVAAATVFFIIYGSTTIPFSERDWIIISDFENLTNEQLFDNSLNTAFTLSINQSRYLNVLTRQRMFQTLGRMEKQDITNIDEETGKEIAVREGVEIMIVPNISKVGQQYILTAKILETKTGDIFKSEVLYAKNEDDIINKLDQLSKKIRRNLGESKYRISDQSKPLSKVTTSSLQALKEYSLGIENHLRLDFEKARIHYENAIRIDSNFTAAKASLGNLLFERYDREAGRKWLDEAIKSIDNLTDREKYSILAFYAANVENDLDKGIAYTKRQVELYPDDPVYHNNLGWYFQNQEKYNLAVDEYKKALGTDPNMVLTYGGLIWIYLQHLGQMDSAMTWTNHMIKYAPDNPWAYFYLGCCHVGLNALEKAETAYLKAGELNLNFLMNNYRLAHTYRLQGKYEKAIGVLEDVLEKNSEEFTAHYDLGINYDLSGKEDMARNHFLEYRKISQKWLDNYPNDPKSYVYYGILLTRMGDKNAGWEIGKRGIEIDSTIYFEYAQLLAVQDRKEEALDYLEKALESGYRDLVWIKLHPDLQVLHTEARFNDLILTFFNRL